MTAPSPSLSRRTFARHGIGRADRRVRNRRRVLVRLVVPAQRPAGARAAVVPRARSCFLRCCPSLSHRAHPRRCSRRTCALLRLDRRSTTLTVITFAAWGCSFSEAGNGMEMGLLAAAFLVHGQRAALARSRACFWLGAGVVAGRHDAFRGGRLRRVCSPRASRRFPGAARSGASSPRASARSCCSRAGGWPSSRTFSRTRSGRSDGRPTRRSAS